jgi:hypothetical protein
VPEVLGVASTESDALDDGDLLCDEQGDALGDDVPVRERARLPLGSPLEDNSGVLLALPLVQILVEPLLVAIKLAEPVGDTVEVGEAVAQIDTDALRDGLEDTLCESAAEREGAALAVIVPEPDHSGVTDTLKVLDAQTVNVADCDARVDTVKLREVQPEELGEGVIP